MKDQFMRKNISNLIILILLILVISSASLTAQDKKALLIGNASYLKAPLRNPVNDVTDMKSALQSSGFSVKVLNNAKKRELDRGIQDFISNLGKGTTALVFYSGHGAQVEGENFIIPVDFAGVDKIDLKYDGYSINRLMEKLDNSGAGIKIVILDACRNNPFSDGKDGTSGLAAMQSSAGTFLAMATAPGKYASDNPKERNGLYTKHLIQAIRAPGLEIDQIFSQVRTNVNNASSGRQQPWNSSSIVGKFYFSDAVVSSSESNRYNQASAASSGGNQSAFSHYVQGNEAFEAGDYQVAVQCYQAAIAKDASLKFALESKIELCKEKHATTESTRLTEERTLILLSEAMDKIKRNETVEAALLLKTIELSDPNNELFVVMNSLVKTRGLLAMDTYRKLKKDKEYRKSLLALMEATKRLNEEALFEYGSMLYRGDMPGIAKNEERAKQYVEMAAKFGHVKSRYVMGLFELQKGKFAEAKNHLNVSSTLGHAEAYNIMGMMYLQGLGVKVDKAYATLLFKEGAKRGSNQAKIKLAEAYTYGYGVEVDYDTAFRWYLASADADGSYPNAVKTGLAANPQYSMDDFLKANNSYNRGYELYYKRDDKLGARRALDHGASQHHMNACLLKGLTFDHSQTQEILKALEFHIIAAEYGSVFGQHLLGQCYYYNDSCKDIVKAKHYYTLAAEQGHAKSAFKLALIYRDEKSQYSQKNANIWMDRAAVLGYVEAIREIGNMHFNGDGRVKSVEAGVTWIELAARLGDEEALVRAAEIYCIGAGRIKPDKNKAYEYYKEAASMGNEKAKEAVRIMRGY